MKKMMQIQSPVRYNIKGAFGDDAQAVFQTNHAAKKYTFGTGRENMQPLHIDDINTKSKKQILTPGPVYQLPKTFGKAG